MVNEENYGAVLHGPHDLRIEKLPIPVIEDNEVLVRMECVGVCGSDLTLYTKGKCGIEVLTDPTVIGHEGAGVIVKIGSKVTNLKVDDRVAIEPTQPCRGCQYCKVGRYNLCNVPRYCSSGGAPGNISRYYKHVADFCHKIPDNMSMEEGAAVQPLGIAIHACTRAGIKLGSTVAIMGAGPIGILCAMTAKSMGASKILMTDVVQSRLDTARELTDAYALLVKPDSYDQAVAEAIVALLGVEPDVTIEASGQAAAQRVAMMVTKTAGVVLVVGIGEPRMDVPLTQALLREVDIRGSYRAVNAYPAAISAVSSGAVDLKSFISHRVPLAKTKEALDLAKSGTAMKVIIHVQEYCCVLFVTGYVPRWKTVQKYPTNISPGGHPSEDLPGAPNRRLLGGIRVVYSR